MSIKQIAIAASMTSLLACGVLGCEKPQPETDEQTAEQKAEAPEQQAEAPAPAAEEEPAAPTAEQRQDYLLEQERQKAEEAITAENAEKVAAELEAELDAQQ